MEYEEYADLVRAAQSAFAEVIARHGGEVVRIVGDGVIAAFGFPDTHEDDGRRATEAALDLHERARRLVVTPSGAAARIRLHSGIHSGLVLFEEGDQVRGRFEPFGDPINIAAHLSALAGEDEIVVSVATLGAERHFFRTGEPKLVGVGGGKAAFLETLSILGRETTENRFAARVRRGLSPFVGRDAELERLGACLDETANGANRMAVVVGSAGIGKTRLAGEFLAEARARGFQVHQGYCESYLGARPLQPFLQLLGSILGIDPTMAADRAGEVLAESVRRLSPDLASRIDALRRLLSLQSGGENAAPKPAPPAAEAAAILREIVERLAEASPVLLFIDDWQWADDISRQALSAVREIQGRRVFTLLATREFGDMDARLSGALVVQLPPLSLEESARTISNLIRAPAPFVVERVADYAGGNPLFIEELCHSQSKGADGDGAEDRAAWLNALIESRFARLPDDHARVVRAASVVGNVIPAWLFEEITGRAADQALTDELARQDFIYSGEVPGTLRFKHGITRDAIYHTVGLRERRALHMRVVGALQHRAGISGEDENCEALAYHFGAGGDRVEAARYAERAGDQAMAVSSLDRAQAQYRAALAALEGLEQTDAVVEIWNAVVRKFGLSAVFDPSLEHIPIIQRAIAAAMARKDVGALAWSEYWLGFMYYGLGQARKSITHCKRALAAAEAFGDDKLTVQIRATLGQAHGTACEYDAATTLLDEAIAIKRSHRSGARQSVGLAYSISCKAIVLADLGRFEEAHAGFDEALGLMGDAPHEMMASILTQRSAACLWRGRMEEAIAHAEKAEWVSERVRARYMFSMSRALQSYARWRIDGSADGLATLVEATSWLEASESRQFIALNYGWLAQAMVAENRIPAARQYAAKAFHRARQGDRVGEAMAWRALATAAASHPFRHPASRYLEKATAAGIERGAAHEGPKTLLCAAEIAALTGDAEGAATLRARARRALETMGMDWVPPPA